MRNEPISGPALRAIYEEALERCRPSMLVRALLRSRPELAGRLPAPATVIALGKCAPELLLGAAGELSIGRCFAALPAGYEREVPAGAEVHQGTHPELSEASFEAGRALLRFVDAAGQPVLVLISGGSSACIEVPLEPFRREELMLVHGTILRAGWTIERMNVVRKHLSAIKGGRLAELLPHGSLTLILSDVSIGHPEMVGSGPTFADRSTNADAARLLESLGEPAIRGVVQRLRDPRVSDTPKETGTEFAVIGDNRTLVESARQAAAERGYATQTVEQEVHQDVEEAARALASLLTRLPPRTIVIAGGEPTVRVRGGGTGGRCSELAVRFSRLASQNTADWIALLGSSDGRDGNTGAAGYVVSSQRFRQARLLSAEMDRALSSSDSFRLVEKMGEPFIIPPTGNNLRDLFLLART